MGRVLLETRSLETGYSGRKVLQGIDLQVSEGEVVALIGHNGGGKSTALKCMFGLLTPWSGNVVLYGESILPSPRRMLAHGIALVLQGGRVLEDLTGLEHIKLRVAMSTEKVSLTQAVERITHEFAELRDKLHHRAGLLSGGERQMLALGTALVGRPKAMLLDEPSLGLSPKLVIELLGWVRQQAREQGVGVLLVEQKVRAALTVSDRAYVLRRGEVSFSGPAKDLLEDSRKLQEAYL